MTIDELREHLGDAPDVAIYVDTPRSVVTADMDDLVGALGSNWQMVRDVESAIADVVELMGQGYALIEPRAAHWPLRH